MNIRPVREIARTCMLAALALAPPAHADEVKLASTVVLSLVGDKLDVITHQLQTGHRLDPNDHQAVPFAEAKLDLYAVQAIATALDRTSPKTTYALVTMSKPEVYEAADKIIDGDHANLPPEIVASAERHHASQLLLVTRRRSDAQLKTSNSETGNGKISGLGFYIDSEQKMRRSDTGQSGRGFLAPFCYVQLSLIDVATSTVLHHQVITADQVLSAARNAEGSDPWGVLTAQQKIDALHRLLGRSLMQAVPAVLGVPPASAASAASAAGE